MKVYTVNWSKGYYAVGSQQIKAASADEAYEKLDEIIGDLEGSMHYDPEQNTIDVQENTRVLK